MLQLWEFFTLVGIAMIFGRGRWNLQWKLRVGWTKLMISPRFCFCSASYHKMLVFGLSIIVKMSDRRISISSRGLLFTRRRCPAGNLQYFRSRTAAIERLPNRETTWWEEANVRYTYILKRDFINRLKTVGLLFDFVVFYWNVSLFS